MATELAAAYVTLIPSLKGAAKTIKAELDGIDVESSGRRWGGSLSKAVGGGISTVAKTGIGAVAAIGAAVGGLAVGGGISRALKIEQAQYNFKAMGLDVESTMASCNEAVKGTAYGLDAAATVASSLGASGVASGNQMTQALKGIAGMAAISGRSMEEIGAIWGKVAADGRIQGDELAQFADNGVAATAALAKYLNKTQAEVREMARAGEIDFATFSDAMNAAFGDAAQGANAIFQGAASNVMAALSRIGAKFASPALNGLRDVFVALIPAIDAVSEALDPLVDIFASACGALSSRAVSAVEAFTAAMTAGEGPVRAVGDALGAAFGGTPLASLASAAASFAASVRDASSPAEALRAIAGGVRDALLGLASAPPLDGLLDGVRTAVAGLPEPVRQAVSALQGLPSKVGEVLGSVNLGGAAAAAGFAGIMARFSGPLGAAVGKIASFGPKAAAALSGLGGASGAVSAVGSKLGALSSAVTLCGGGIKGFASVAGGLLRGALVGIASPVGIAVAAIAALAAAFAYLMATDEGFRSTVGQLAGQIGASLAPALAVVAATLGNLAATLLPVVSNAVAMLVPVLGQVITVILQVVAALAPVVAVLVATVVPVIAQIISMAVQVAAAILSVVLPAVSMILSAIQENMPVIQSVITTVMNAVLAVVRAVWPVIQAVIGAAMNVIRSVIQIVTGLINGDWSQVWEGIKSLAGSVWEGIKSVVSAAIGAVKGVIGSVMESIKGAWESAWSSVKSFFSDIWDGIKSGAEAGVGAVMDTVSGIKDSITGFFAGAASWLLDSGASIVQGLADGISGAIGKATGAISDVVSSVRDFLPFSPAKRGPFSGKGWTLYSGRSISEALGQGVADAAPAARSAMAGLMEDMSGIAEAAPFGSVSAGSRRIERIGAARGDDAAGDIMDLLERYLPGMASQQLVLDTGVVAGAVTPYVDKGLGMISNRRSKGL